MGNRIFELSVGRVTYVTTLNNDNESKSLKINYLRKQVRARVDSHLAFLIRLLSKENIFGLFPLTEIFNFFSANFSTKRRKHFPLAGSAKNIIPKTW